MVSTEIKEIRWVIERDISNCYVLYGAVSDGTIGIQGWHKKSFGLNTGLIDILNNWDSDNPMLWGQEAPNASK